MAVASAASRRSIRSICERYRSCVTFDCAQGESARLRRRMPSLSSRLSFFENASHPGDWLRPSILASSRKRWGRQTCRSSAITASYVARPFDSAQGESVIEVPSNASSKNRLRAGPPRLRSIT